MTMLREDPTLLNSVEAGGFGAMHFAAFNGDLDLLRLLLSHHADVNLVNYDDNTPLVMAVKGHQLEAITMLLEAGAEVNMASTSSGATAAHHAAAMGYVDCLRLLVKAGATVHFDALDAGSLLHWACHSGQVDCVGAMLYEFNVDVNTVDSHGGTALLTALFMEKLAVV
uniref:Ankyrin repeat, PH and SEC7 domain containing protein secG n=1 Tax=Lygus hesperus TaxID=30085 RepID=A0A0A9Z1C0_LYGHE